MPNVQYINTESFQKTRQANLSLLIGSSILIFVCSTLLAASIFFAFGYSISFLQITIGACTCIFFVWWGTNRYFRQDRFKIFWTLLLVLAIVFAASLYISGKFYDLSWDGQAYHQEAVVQIARGWNPFMSEFSPYRKIRQYFPVSMDKSFSKHIYLYKPLFKRGVDQCCSAF